MRIILKQTLIPGIDQQIDGRHNGFQDYIENSDEFYITASPQKTEFEIGFASKESVVGCMQKEISNFTCAALESLRDITRSAPYRKNNAWASVKIYYAAYYSANAIMRFAGCGSTNLDRRHTSRIENKALSSGIKGDTPEKGVYQYEIDLQNRIIKFIEVSSSDGAHGKFWRAFQRFLPQLEKNIQSTIGIQSDKDEINNYVSNITRIMERNNFSGGNWLSKVRNDINYKFGHGVWPPYTNSSQKLDSFFNDIVTHTISPTTYKGHKDDVLFFADGCTSINKICIEYIEALSSLNRKKKFFINKHPVPILEEIKKIIIN